MVVHGTDGDVYPFLRIGAALRSRGHEVTLFSHEYYAGAARRAGLELVPVDTVAGYEAYLADAAEQFHATALADFRAHCDRTGLFAQMDVECRELAARYRPGATVLVGAPIAAQSVLIAGEALAAPVAAVAASPFQLSGLAGVAGIYRDVLADRVDAVRDRAGLGPVKDWPAWMASAQAYLGLWPAWFDAAGPPAPPGTGLAGFVPPDADTPDPLPPAVAHLLDAASPGQEPVLVTGGTGRLLHRGFYRTAIDAVRAVGRTALVVVRHRDLVPDPMPPGTHWFPRLPFPAVIPRVAAVVHHGGLGTLARALAAGTPQLVLAGGMDRPDNARRLAGYGLARWLPEPRWTVPEAAAELAALLRHGPVPPPEPVGDGAERAADLLAAVLPGVTR